jgi:hypothetical protein
MNRLLPCLLLLLSGCAKKPPPAPQIAAWEPVDSSFNGCEGG